MDNSSWYIYVLPSLFKCSSLTHSSFQNKKIRVYKNGCEKTHNYMLKIENFLVLREIFGCPEGWFLRVRVSNWHSDAMLAKTKWCPCAPASHHILVCDESSSNNYMLLIKNLINSAKNILVSWGVIFEGLCVKMTPGLCDPALYWCVKKITIIWVK